MANNTIIVVDFDDSIKQRTETLILASILEKRCKKLTVIDLNQFNDNVKIVPKTQFKEKAGVLTTKLFDLTNLIVPADQSITASKLVNLVKSEQNKCDTLIINSHSLQYSVNNDVVGLTEQIVLFADIANASKTILEFFLKREVKDKKVFIFVTNYVDNVQNNKEYLNILLTFKNNKNVVIEKLNKINDYKTLNEIANIDPWVEIYSKINEKL